MTGPARAARQRELTEERERQRRCFLEQHQGLRNQDAQPDTWRWGPGDTDWCAQGDLQVVLTPVEAESCRLYAAKIYARNPMCEQWESPHPLHFSNRCQPSIHDRAYRRHKERHGYRMAGNGKCMSRCRDTGWGSFEDADPNLYCIAVPYGDRRGRYITAPRQDRY